MFVSVGGQATHKALLLRLRVDIVRLSFVGMEMFRCSGTDFELWINCKPLAKQNLDRPREHMFFVSGKNFQFYGCVMGGHRFACDVKLMGYTWLVEWLDLICRLCAHTCMNDTNFRNWFRSPRRLAASGRLASTSALTASLVEGLLSSAAAAAAALSG